MDTKFILLITIGLGIWGGVYWQATARRRELRQVARKIGFDFQVKTPLPEEIRKANFRVVDWNILNDAHNVLYRVFGDYQVALFDFAIGGSEMDFGREGGLLHTVFVFTSQASSLPVFNLYPEKYLRRFAQVYLDFADIDFGDDPYFSGAYILNGMAEPSIRTLFDKDIRKLFSREKDLFVESRGHSLLFYRKGFLATPEQVTETLGEITLLYESLRKAWEGRAAAA